MAEKDFIGFTFDGVHFDDLGIVRVSDGDRFDEQLHPEIKDITAEVPGMDGEYYFGSTYGNKEIEIKIAYDSLTESQFRELRRVFSGRRIHELIFDERPYKKYLVKLSGPIELNYICFDEYEKQPFSKANPTATLPDGVRMVDDGHGNRVREKIDPWVYSEESRRIYKGEGTISFIAYFPFAKSAYKILPEVAPDNMDEWKESSGLLAYNEYHDIIDTYKIVSGQGVLPQVYGFKVYNAGDLETGFRLYIPDEILTTQAVNLVYKLYNESDSEAELHLKQFEEMKAYGYDVVENPSGNPQEQGWYELKNKKFVLTEDLSVVSGKTYYSALSDMGVIVDTNNGLITGVQQAESIVDQDMNPIYTTTGNLYNEYVDYGSFFKLQTTSKGFYDTLEINGNNDTYIFYDYLYF